MSNCMIGLVKLVVLRTDISLGYVNRDRTNCILGLSLKC